MLFIPGACCIQSTQGRLNLLMICRQNGANPGPFSGGSGANRPAGKQLADLQATYLFEKVLTSSDANGQGRIVVPKVKVYTFCCTKATFVLLCRVDQHSMAVLDSATGACFPSAISTARLR